MEVEAPSLELGTVSLIQAVKIPVRHQKLVRIQVAKNSFEQQQLIFEPLLTSSKKIVCWHQRPWFLLILLIGLI